MAHSTAFVDGRARQAAHSIIEHQRGCSRDGIQRVRPRAFVDLDIDATRRTAREEAWLLRYTATTYEPHLQRADVRLLYDRFDQRALAERLVTDFACHIYFPAERELLFLSAGLEIAQQYGDYRSCASIARGPVW